MPSSTSRVVMLTGGLQEAVSLTDLKALLDALDDPPENERTLSGGGTRTLSTGETRTLSA